MNTFWQSLRINPPTWRPTCSMEGRAECAFTRVELLVVVLVLTMLVLVFLPALARTQPESRAFQCINNHRQLTRAWLMYAADNDDRLAVCLTTMPSVNFPVWAAGWLDWSPNSDNTNTILLANPRYSALANYCGRNARLFKCPADQYLSTIQRSLGWRERVRSVSQNLCAASGNATGVDAYVQVTKLAGLVNPKPAETWVSIDEHADSINDGALYPPRTDQWIDVPAGYHEGGAGVAFADGRAEIHRWKGNAMRGPIRFTPNINLPSTAGDPDLEWLRHHTPRRAGAN